jgi:tetratricopeptide (TPR) repeat protein
VQEGLALFERAQQLDPDELQAWLWPMYGLEALEQHERADALLRQVLGLLDEDVDAARAKLAQLVERIDVDTAASDWSVRSTGAALAARHGL